MNKEKIMENIIKYKSETHEAAVDKFECGYAQGLRVLPANQTSPQAGEICQEAATGQLRLFIRRIPRSVPYGTYGRSC